MLSVFSAWDRLANASVWARRASWLFKKAVPRSSRVESLGKSLQIYEADKLLVTVAVRTFGGEVRPRSVKEMDLKEGAAMNVRCDLFPCGAAVIDTGRTRIWGEVQEIKCTADTTASADAIKSVFRNNLGKVPFPPAFKWFFSVVCIIAGLMWFFCDVNIAYDFKFSLLVTSLRRWNAWR